MAEALGVTSSIITIWDVVNRAKKLYGKAKNAPDAWKRYSEELESLAHVQTVLASMIQNSPWISNQMIQIEGKSQSLVAFVNERLETVRKEAANILDQYRGLEEKPSTSERLKQIFQTWKFALADQDIRDLIQAAEHAKSSLQSALCLVHLETLDSWQQETRQDFQVIHDNMRKQAKALQVLENSKKLSQIPLQVSPPSNRQGPKKPVTRTRSLTEKLRFGSKSSTKTPLPTSTQPALSTRRAGAGLEKKIGETQSLGGLEVPIDGYDAEDEKVEEDEVEKEEVEKEIDDEPIEDGDSSSSESEMANRDGRTQEREYDVICRNGKILSIGTDTEEYRSAFSDDETLDATTTRLDDVVEAMTDEEWTRYVESGPEELYAYLTSAPCTAACSDVEPMDEESPIYMDLQKPTSAFIGETVHLRACLSHIIQAWVRDDAWESDTPTEKAASDAENDAFPSEPGQGDNKLAFALLEAIKRASCAESSEIPDQVPFDVLVGFLKLTEKYSLGEPYLTQGKEWTAALLPSIPKSLDKDAVA
ncbi:hypothetical protein Neosp_013919 [[Neocosmospora] mangrovei]